MFEANQRRRAAGNIASPDARPGESPSMEALHPVARRESSTNGAHSPPDQSRLVAQLQQKVALLEKELASAKANRVPIWLQDTASDQASSPVAHGLREKVHMLEGQLQGLLEEKQDLLQTVEDGRASASLVIDELENCKSALAQTTAELARERAAAKAMQSQLARANDAHKAEVLSLETDIVACKVANDEAVGKYGETQGTIHELSIASATLQQRNKALEKTVQDLQQDITLMEGRLAEREAAEQELESRRARSADAHQSATRANRSLEARVAELEAEKSRLEDERAHADSRLITLEVERNEAVDQCKELLGELRKAHGTLQTREEEVRRLKERSDLSTSMRRQLSMNAELSVSNSAIISPNSESSPRTRSVRF